MNYTKITSEMNQDFIVKTDENGFQTWIPADPANSDYQVYLATLAANSAPTA